ncbi:Fic family protein [Psychromonas sp. KJ10-10]|uniref:Fic family protein n=1 Tax=Psychromonas sp. KJ10-10 TaxID=3391823 RepID=UPI0039B5A2F9
MPVNRLGPQVTPQVSPQVNEQVLILLNVMRSEKESHKTSNFKRETLQALLGLKDKKSFSLRYLKPALSSGVIKMTIPDKPNSRLQQYELTELGKLQLKECGQYNQNCFFI